MKKINFSKKFFLIILCLVLVLAVCIFGVSYFIKKVSNRIEYNYENIGIKSSFDNESNDNFDKFEVKKDSDVPYLYFENSKLKTKYKLQYNVVTNVFLKRVDKELSSLDRYKKIKIGDYDGYIYSRETGNNYARLVLKLKEEENSSYVIYLDVNALSDSEEDYVFDSVVKDKEIVNFLSSIKFDTDIDKYYRILRDNSKKIDSSKDEK